MRVLRARVPPVWRRCDPDGTRRGRPRPAGAGCDAGRQGSNLGTLQRAGTSGLEVAEADRADADPDEPRDRRVDRAEHPPKLALPALGERRAVPASAGSGGGSMRAASWRVSVRGRGAQRLREASPGPRRGGCPALSARTWSAVSGRASATAYSRSTPKRGWRTRSAQSPSFVSSSSPSESWSSRPTGYSRVPSGARAVGTRSRTVVSAWRSRVVEVTPAGLWSAT